MPARYLLSRTAHASQARCQPPTASHIRDQHRSVHRSATTSAIHGTLVADLRERPRGSASAAVRGTGQPQAFETGRGGTHGSQDSGQGRVGDECQRSALADRRRSQTPHLPMPAQEPPKEAAAQRPRPPRRRTSRAGKASHGKSYLSASATRLPTVSVLCGRVQEPPQMIISRRSRSKYRSYPARALDSCRTLLHRPQMRFSLRSTATASAAGRSSAVMRDGGTVIRSWCSLPLGSRVRAVSHPTVHRAPPVRGHRWRESPSP